MLYINRINTNVITISESSDPVGSDDWSQLAFALESGSYDDSNPITFREASAAPGSVISGVNYKISDSSTVPITWKVLGYNAAIPEHVKYRRAVGTGYKHVWVSSTKLGLLAPIAVGDYARTRTYDSSTGDYTWSSDANSEAIIAVGSTTFTYGNNCPYSVPMSITTAKGVYTFCGYNMVIQTEAILLDKDQDAAEYTYYYFDKAQNKNRYGSAPIRNFLNNMDGTVDANYSSNYQAKTLLHKMVSETGFLKNVAKTVNRTWVQDSWRSDTGIVLDENNCEHIVDKFWLLGFGNVRYNYNGTNADDYVYDTTKFRSVFTDNAARVKNFMTSDGSVGSNAYRWWLRSAYAAYDSIGTFVDIGGYVGNVGTNRCHGIAPAATIG